MTITIQPGEVYRLFRESMLDKTDDWMELISDDVSLIGPLAQVTGKDKFIELNRPFFASIHGGVLYELVEKDNTVITRIRTDIAMPSGKNISLQVSEWYKIEGGKIVSLMVYFDTAEFISEMKAG
jgi:limonene-1,2-epoxide hydrolase